MPFQLKTSDPIAALFRGALAGVALLVLFWILDLPFDLKFGCVLFALGLAVGTISAYDRAPKHTGHGRPPVKVLMDGIAWDFATPAPAEFDSFIEAVGNQQSDVGRWMPDKSLGHSGSLTIELLPFWQDGGDSAVIIELDSPDGEDWTHGRLLHALHHQLSADTNLGDAVFFEGLAMLGTGRYRLLLGS